MFETTVWFPVMGLTKYSVFWVTGFEILVFASCAIISQRVSSIMAAHTLTVFLWCWLFYFEQNYQDKADMCFILNRIITKKQTWSWSISDHEPYPGNWMWAASTLLWTTRVRDLWGCELTVRTALCTGLHGTRHASLVVRQYEWWLCTGVCGLRHVTLVLRVEVDCLQRYRASDTLLLWWC